MESREQEVCIYTWRNERAADTNKISFRDCLMKTTIVKYNLRFLCANGKKNNELVKFSECGNKL